MCESNDLNLRVTLAVNYKVWKPPEWNSAHSKPSLQARDSAARSGAALNQDQGRIDFRQ